MHTGERGWTFDFDDTHGIQNGYARLWGVHGALERVLENRVDYGIDAARRTTALRKKYLNNT